MVKEDKEKIIGADYKIQNFKINRDNISKFEILQNRRQICDTHVGKMHKVLIGGKNPIGVLIVNERDGKLRLIDGNHRLEAIKRFFGYKESFSKVSVECVLKIYHNLNDEEEREVYANEAKRRNESYEDRLNMYKEVITFWKLLQDKLNPFPCEVTIYGSKNSIKFRVVLNAIYSSVNSSDEGYSPATLGKEEIVSFASELGWDDYTQLKEFINFFQSIFGRIEESNIYTRTNFFNCVLDIYYRNRQYKDDKTFKERFTKLIGRSDLITYVNMGGREARIKMRQIMIEYLNSGYSVKRFV